MKKAVVTTVLLSIFILTSFVACTRNSKDRQLKGSATVADQKDGKQPNKTPDGKVPAVDGGDTAGTGSSSSVGGLDDGSGQKIAINPGFLQIADAPQQLKALEDGIVTLSVSRPTDSTTAEQFMAKPEIKALLKDKTPTTIEELITALTGQTPKAESKVEGQTTEGLNTTAVIEQKVSNLEMTMALIQLESCKKLQKNLQSCQLFPKAMAQSGFAISANEFVTSIDFLSAYVQTILQNDEEFKKLSNIEEQYNYLTTGAGKSLAVLVTKTGLSLSYAGLQAAEISQLSKKGLEKVLSLSKSFDASQLNPQDSIVKIRLTQSASVIGGAKGLQGLTVASGGCSSLKDSKLHIVGFAMEATSGRTNKGNPKLKDSVKGQINLSEGKAVDIKVDSLKKLPFAKDMNEQDVAAAKNGIIATSADAVSGFAGAAIVNEQGQAIGVLTIRIDGEISLGACLK